MSFFNFSKKPSQGISLHRLRQLVLNGSGRLRIVAASDWFLTRADGSTPDNGKHYRQQGDTLYICDEPTITRLTGGGHSIINDNNSIASISNSVIGSIVQTTGSTVMTGNGNVQGDDAQRFDFVLHAPRLPRVNASGRVAIEVEGSGFTGQSIQCELSGEASFVCHDAADARMVELDLTGSSFVEIGGSANALQLEVTGSGEMDLSACRAESATVNVTGSGRIEVNVSETLEGSITGSGTVIHVGEPRHKRIDVRGSGRVRQRQR